MYELAGEAANVLLAGIALFGGASWWCWKASQANRDTEYTDALSRIHERTWDDLYPRIIQTLGPELSRRLAEPLRHSARMKLVLERLTIGSSEQVTWKLDDVFQDLIATVEDELKRTALHDLGATPDLAGAYQALQMAVFPRVEDAFRLRSCLRGAQRCLRRAACAFLVPIPVVAYMAGTVVIPTWRQNIATAAIVGAVVLLPGATLACAGLLKLLGFNDIRQHWMSDSGN